MSAKAHYRTLGWHWVRLGVRLDRDIVLTRTYQLPQPLGGFMTIVQNQLEPSRLKYFEIQKALYKTAKPQLVERYLGEFIAFEDGRVLDHDSSEQTLVQRVYQQYGYRDLLIKQVWLEEPHLSVAGVFHSVGEE